MITALTNFKFMAAYRCRTSLRVASLRSSCAHRPPDVTSPDEGCYKFGVKCVLTRDIILTAVTVSVHCQCGVILTVIHGGQTMRPAKGSVRRRALTESRGAVVRACLLQAAAGADVAGLVFLVASSVSGSLASPGIAGSEVRFRNSLPVTVTDSLSAAKKQ